MVVKYGGDGLPPEAKRIYADESPSQDAEEQQIEWKVLLKELEVKRANKIFICAACKSPHVIKDCHAIQTHWYVEPSGCSDGDYWNEGELQILCPTTGVRNRLLFPSQRDMDWERRKQFAYSAELQFKRMYKRLFKSVTEEHERHTKGTWENNLFVDKNRGYYDIHVEGVDK